MTPPAHRSARLALAVAVLLAVPAGSRAADTTPPAVTIAVPSAITAPVRVSFAEAVRRVRPSNLVVRVVRSSSNVVASVRCLGASGAAVGCERGPVRSAEIRPASPFVPGQQYVAIATPPGAAPIVDLAGNAGRTASRWFRGAVSQEETSARATPRWRRFADAGAFGGSYVAEDAAGAKALARFAGSSVTWYTVTGPDQGIADVYVDGVRRSTVDNFGAPATRVARRVSGLSSRAHSLSIVARGTAAPLATGTLVAVDQVEGPGGPVPVTYAWQHRSSSGASGGAYSASDTPGASYELTFRGTGIDLRTSAGPSRGRIDVSVDGAFRRTFDLYAPAQAWTTMALARNLGDAVHALRLVVRTDRNASATGTTVIVDRFDVKLTDVLMFRRLGAWIDRFDMKAFVDDGIPPSAVVADLDAQGVRTIYIQSGHYKRSEDIVLPETMKQWIDASHAAGMRIVGWYLPGYADMARDVRRTLAVKSFRTATGEAFDAVGVDIEDRSELDPLYDNSADLRTAFMSRIADHLRRVRAAVGTSYPVAAIPPAPLGMAVAPTHWQGFPWAAIGRYTNVVMPMGYWSYRHDCDTNPDHCPYGYTRGNVTEARRLTGLPVHVIGGVGDADGVTVPTREIADFVRGARSVSAFGGSIYDYRETHASYWPELRKLNAS